MEESRVRERRVRFLSWFAVIIPTLCIGFAALYLLAGYLLVQREGARRDRCAFNLAQLYRATNEYADSYGAYPPCFTQDAAGRKLHSWRVLLLPYLGESELFGQIRLDEPWDSEWNSQFWSKTPSVYQCVSMPYREGQGYRVITETERCAFSCVLAEDGLFAPDGSSATPESVTDGASNTIMYVERKSPVNWMNPNVELTKARVLEENANPMAERVDFGSWHGRGVSVLFCDGATKFLSEKIDSSVLALLIGARDSEKNASAFEGDADEVETHVEKRSDEAETGELEE
ncbi:MAG: DUF1559 domain-containing protein [Thermoguttaceae bacterium]|jgi:prepilin-type processing-associated H-X9-DG protein